MSQIQDLGPRFRSQVLENVLDLCSRSQVQVLSPRMVQALGPISQKRVFRSQKMSQIQDLGPRDLGPRSQKMSQIYVLGPRFRSLSPRMVQALGPISQKRTQIQVLSSRKCPKFMSYVVDLYPRSQKMSQSYILGHRFRSQDLENILDLGPKA